MIDIQHLEALVGPLPKGQALKQSLEEIKSVTNDIALLMLRLTELPPKIDDALDEAYERLKQQAAELAEARFFADGWHKQFRRVNKARHEEKARAERIEAEARKLVAALFTELDEEEATDVILAAFPHGAPAWVLAHYDAERGGGA